MCCSRRRLLGCLQLTISTYILIGFGFSFTSPTSAAFPVCLTQAPGFVDCSINSPSFLYTGYDVEAFRYIATTAGWVEVPDQSNISTNTTDYYFVCTNMTAQEVVSLMASNTTTESSINCSMATGMV